MSTTSAHTSLQVDALRRMRASSQLGQTIHYFDSVDSTNTVAQRLAADGAAEGTAVIAETQTRGRGRLGRAWSSPPFRNLYLSIVLRPPIAAAAAPQIALVAGLATTEAARHWAPSAAVKWPNDVVLDGRKLGGILAELESEGEHARCVILGIGVNLNSTAEDFPEDLRDKAIGLCTAAGRPIDRVEFADHLLSRLEETYDLYLRSGFAAIRPLWERRSALTGRHVRIETGRQCVEAVVTGLADDGTLLLRNATGETLHVVAGDVTVVGGYA
jgi:BirA family biotin operon repressor/biotin-[acetyl-CoA-carboxylase] ligase